MTHPGPARDVDLEDWLRSVGFHPADTRLKQLGHEAVRALIGNLGVQLHYIVPPGADKSVLFRKLREVMFYANAQLATAGGPNPDGVTEGSLRGMLEDLLGDAVRPADPRPEFAVPEDPDEASAWLDRANAAVNAAHPGVGYTPAPAAVRPDLEPDDDAPRGYYLEGRKRLPIPMDDAKLTHRMRGFRNSAGFVAGLSDSPLVWVATADEPPAGARDLEPDDQAPRGYWHDGAARWPIPIDDQDLDARHAGFANSAGVVVYGGDGTWAWWPAKNGAPPTSDGTTPGHISRLKLTPAAAEVTAPAEPGGVADRAANLDAEGHTIWGMNPTRTKDDADLGVTLTPGGVGLAILGGPRAALIHSPGTAASGYGINLRSLDAVNMVLETIAAAAGRAFGQE